MGDVVGAAILAKEEGGDGGIFRVVGCGRPVFEEVECGQSRYEEWGTPELVASVDEDEAEE